MEVRRTEEFAPVKNKTGEDSPESSRAAQSALFRLWLADAGFPVIDSQAAVEIGPLYALDRGELQEKLRRGAGRPLARVYLD